MKNFFRSIWPTTIPGQINAGDEIAILRERIIQSFSLISLWVGIAVLALILPTYIQVQRWGLIGIYFAFLFAMIGVTFIRQIPYRIRGLVILIVVYAIALGSLLVYGLSGNGPVLLIGFVALSAIFMGTRPGIGAALIALGTMAAVGYMMVNRNLPLPPVELQANAASLFDWINRTLVVTLLAVSFTISLAVMVKGLRNALSEQRQIGLALDQEKKLLEERVQERTSELEWRAFELETASKIARDISQIDNLDELLDRAVNLIQSEYHLYYVGIYLTDTHREYAALHRGSGEAGGTMMAMNFRIPLSDAQPVSLAIVKNEIRLTQDVINEPLFVRNPLLAETRAQLAIPLVTGGKVIGALDAQSNIRRFFRPNDIHSLQITADQLAVAIEKALIVQQLTTALEEMRDTYRQSTVEAWQGFHRAARRNFSYHIRQGKIETGPLAQMDSFTDIATGKPLIQKYNDHQTGLPYTMIAIPIKSRDQVLGILNLRFNSGQLSANIIDLLESVSSRLALAIENARLIEENLMKAARDQTVGEISARVRAETDIDKVMRIVATELGRSLGVSDVIVQLRENQR
jgi:GAF domain-containing protein